MRKFKYINKRTSWLCLEDSKEDNLLDSQQARGKALEDVGTETGGKRESIQGFKCHAMDFESCSTW